MSVMFPCSRQGMRSLGPASRVHVPRKMSLVVSNRYETVSLGGQRVGPPYFLAFQRYGVVIFGYKEFRREQSKGRRKGYQARAASPRTYFSSSVFTSYVRTHCRGQNFHARNNQEVREFSFVTRKDA